MTLQSELGVGTLSSVSTRNFRLQSVFILFVMSSITGYHGDDVSQDLLSDKISSEGVEQVLVCESGGWLFAVIIGWGKCGRLLPLGWLMEGCIESGPR